VPVIVKETGCGMSERTVARLLETGVQVVDVSGRGGTHWGRIEGARAAERVSGATGDSLSHARLAAHAAETFRDWGISTVESVLGAASAMTPAVTSTTTRKETASGKRELWASGGVRSGLDCAKLIALGSHRVGFAQPALAAAVEDTLDAWMARVEFELKVALFGTGCASPEALRWAGMERDKVWTFSRRN